jgi:hypothetical protein
VVPRANSDMAAKLYSGLGLDMNPSHVQTYTNESARYLPIVHCNDFMNMYEGRLKSSWTHVITPIRKFVEVR